MEGRVTQKSVFLLSTVIQLTSLVLFEGVGEGVSVGFGIWKGVWRQGLGGVQASV